MNEYIDDDESCMLEQQLLLLSKPYLQKKREKYLEEHPELIKKPKHTIVRRKKETDTTQVQDDTNQTDKPKKQRKKQQPLKPRFHETETHILEAGIDEAGRGPLFGRVYSACVILPSGENSSFDHSKLKDSKKFTSKKKLMEVYQYILDNAIDYAIWYEDETSIDNINIRNATHKAMNECIKQLKTKPDYLLVDGCDFTDTHKIPYVCIEGGDNLYTPIAGASILAKVARDTYIEELCQEYPYLEEKYGILSNKGYGTKKHLDGIREHGITPWHRKTYGICKNYV